MVYGVVSDGTGFVQPGLDGTSVIDSTIPGEPGHDKTNLQHQPSIPGTLGITVGVTE